MSENGGFCYVYHVLLAFDAEGVKGAPSRRDRERASVFTTVKSNGGGMAHINYRSMYCLFWRGPNVFDLCVRST